jgi:ketosteroid isomerase-like protein
MTTLEIAQRYAGILGGQAEPTADIFASEVSLWWNTNPAGQTIAGDKFAAALAAGHPTPGMADYRVEIETVREMQDGFVVTVAVRGTQPDGTPAEALVCQIVTVEDGRIVRWEEFVDQGQHVPFHG